MQTPTAMPSPQPYNPCAALPGARQTNETIAHFLQRLPPAQAALTTPRDELPPWYWIANPHRSAYPTGRAETGDLASFTANGLALLEEFKQYVAQRPWDRRRRAEVQDALRRAIAEAAGRAEVTAGKWMLFPRVDEVNEVWRTVCEGVDANRLGTAAKVSTSGNEDGDPARLICVYTKDFRDVEDVRRVLTALVEMGLVKSDAPRGIRYKCDAYTYLGIYGQNEYGLRPSMYSSVEMLTG